MTRLPSWCQSTEARLLLSLAVEERPERTRVLTEMLDGTPVDYGFRGKHAHRLRKLFEPTLTDLMNWADAGTDEEDRLRRREAVARYQRESGPDATIARLIAERDQAESQGIAA